MSQRAFLEEQARQRASEAVKAVEAQTSAEVVVAVRRRSASYRGASYLFASLCSCGALGHLFLSPKLYDVRAIPLELLLAFGLGFLVASALPPLQRLFTLERHQVAQVAMASRAAFYDLGIAGTRGRNGILIYVSLLERRVEVLSDLGVDEKRLGEGWATATQAMRAAVRRFDFAALLAAIEGLGPVLAKVMPRSEDDVNELGDEPC